jgi:hypothetical protein
MFIGLFFGEDSGRSYHRGTESLSLPEIPAVPGNCPVFLRMYHQYANGRIRGSDVLIGRSTEVLFGIKL